MDFDSCSRQPRTACPSTPNRCLADAILWSVSSRRTRSLSGADLVIGLLTLVVLGGMFVLKAIGEVLTAPFGVSDPATSLIVGTVVVFGGGGGLVLVVVFASKRAAFRRLATYSARRRRIAINRKLQRRERPRALQIAAVDQMAGREFEFYVAELLTHQGFAAQVTQGSNDLGVDIIARNGARRIAVQCKRYDHKVDRNAISDVVGGMSHYGCNAGMVVTNNYFQRGATKLANSNSITLIDRDVLSDWIIAFQGGHAHETAQPVIPGPPQAKPGPVTATTLGAGTHPQRTMVTTKLLEANTPHVANRRYSTAGCVSALVIFNLLPVVAYVAFGMVGLGVGLLLGGLIAFLTVRASRCAPRQE